MSGQVVHQTDELEPAVIKALELFDNLFEKTSLGPFAIKLWDGSLWQQDKTEPRFHLEIKNAQALQKIFWRPNQLSLGEAYIFDDFDIHGDLEACFELGDYLMSRDWQLSEKLRLGQKLLSLSKKPAKKWYGTPKMNGRAHTKRRDAKAVQYHYNLSNDFYRLWLDQNMVYSCAYFHSMNDTLDEAQERKLDYICRKLRLNAGERVLDIGCGWGGLIIHAAKNYGVETFGITLSEPQADWAKRRIEAAGLSNRCHVEVLDYRDLSEDIKVDKLVSVGMFEHVGEEQLPVYFSKAYDLLRPGGVFLNHGITRAVHYDDTGPSFIDKYVFPDGELMPISVSLRCAEEAGFEIRDVENLREHYSLTLRHWVRRLERNIREAINLTSSETYRIWRLYMAGSAAGFNAGRIGLCQSLLAKPCREGSGLPLTRCDWYQPCPNGRS